MIRLKIQYNTYEDGEFTEENEYSLEEIIEVINTNTKPIHFKRSTQINKQRIKFYFQNGENYLKAEHIGKNAFHVYYCNDPETKLYQGNYYLPKLIKLITLFYKGEYNELNRIIPKTSIHEKKLIRTFVAEDFVYSKKNVGLFNFIMWSVFPLIFITPFLINPSIPTMLILALGLPFSIPIIFIIRIHNNYKDISTINAIKISVGINEIVIWENSIEYKFDKSDIVDLLIVDPNMRWAHRGTPFDSYGYTQIKLKNGKNIIITSAVINIIEMEYKVWNIPHKVEKRFYPYIQSKNSG